MYWWGWCLQTDAFPHCEFAIVRRVIPALSQAPAQVISSVLNMIHCVPFLAHDEKCEVLHLFV